MAIDPERLRRALALKVERVDSAWLVSGRLVDPEEGCACPDRRLRGATCKHELAARLDVLDPELREALGEIVGATQAQPVASGY